MNGAPSGSVLHLFIWGALINQESSACANQSFGLRLIFRAEGRHEEQGPTRFPQPAATLTVHVVLGSILLPVTVDDDG